LQAKMRRHMFDAGKPHTLQTVQQAIGACSQTPIHNRMQVYASLCRHFTPLHAQAMQHTTGARGEHIACHMPTTP
jgi:hypothetical protein